MSVDQPYTLGETVEYLRGSMCAFAALGGGALASRHVALFDRLGSFTNVPDVGATSPIFAAARKVVGPEVDGATLRRVLSAAFHADRGFA